MMLGVYELRQIYLFLPRITYISFIRHWY